MTHQKTSVVHGPFAIASLALSLAACVTSPGNGGEVSSTSAPVGFSGAGLAPSRVVTVEASSSPSGPFVAIAGATATTSLRPTQTVALPGGGSVPLYGFSLKTTIPARRWHAFLADGCHGSETFVRVRDGAFSYLTFDTDTAAIACIEGQLAVGDSVTEALNSCRSAQSPVLRLTQGITTHVGDVVIDDASDLAALACVQTIDGSLTVTSTVPNLVSLPHLHHVTGDVNLKYTSYAPDPHPPTTAYPALRCGASHYVTAEVRVFDLPVLTQVGGDLILYQEGHFSGLSTQAIDLHLNALTSVGGDVSITVNQFGGSPCGLTALGYLPGDLTVDLDNGGEVDSTISGLLSALTEVAGTVTFNGGHNAFGNPLSSLHRAGGLHIIKSPVLSGFHFPALTEVTGTVELDGTGPGSAPTGLATVGHLIVHDSAYISLESIGGPALALGGLDLQANGALTALTNAGTSKVTLSPSAPLTIAGNAALPSSEVCNFVALQSGLGWSGTSSLGGVTCP